MDANFHYPDHHDDHNTYEEGIHLNWAEKMTLFAILGGMAFLMLLVLIGIGF